VQKIKGLWVDDYGQNTAKQGVWPEVRILKGLATEYSGETKKASDVLAVMG
jgi:hypothetical protein